MNILDNNMSDNNKDSVDNLNTNNVDNLNTNNTEDTNNNTDNTLDWKQYIPEHLKTRNEWDRIKSLDNLFENYINMNQYNSGAVKIPSKEATPDEIVNFYKKIGTPSTPDDYSIKENEAVGMVGDEFNTFKNMVHKANLTKKQAEDLYNIYTESIQNEISINQTKMKDAEEQCRKQLMDKWLGNYNNNINQINAKINNLFDSNTMSKFEKAGLLIDSDFIEKLHNLTNKFTSDNINSKSVVDNNKNITIEDLNTEIQKLISKKDKSVEDNKKIDTLIAKKIKLRQANK